MKIKKKEEKQESVADSIINGTFNTHSYLKQKALAPIKENFINNHEMVTEDTVQLPVNIEKKASVIAPVLNNMNSNNVAKNILSGGNNSGVTQTDFRNMRMLAPIGNVLTDKKEKVIDNNRLHLKENATENGKSMIKSTLTALNNNKKIPNSEENLPFLIQKNDKNNKNERVKEDNIFGTINNNRKIAEENNAEKNKTELSASNKILLGSKNKSLGDYDSKFLQGLMSSKDAKIRARQTNTLSSDKKDISKALLQTRQEQLEKQAEETNEIMKNGNLIQKTGAVLGNVGRNFTLGATSGFTDMFSMASNFPTNLANSLGIESVQQKNDKAINAIDFTNTYKNLKELEQNYNNQLDNEVLKTTGRLSQVVGNMLPALTTGGLAESADATAKIAQAVTSWTNALNSGASAYNDNLNEDQSNYFKAGLKAGFYGLATKTIEGITGNNFIQKTGSLDDFAVKNIAKLKSEFSKKIAAKIYEATGEALEENVENITDHMIDFAFGDAEGITPQMLLEEAKQTTGDTMIVNIILQTLGLGGGTYNDVKMYEANQNMQNEMSQLQNQYNNTIEPALKATLAKQIEEIASNTSNLPNNEVLQESNEITQEQNKMAQNANVKQENINDINSQQYSTNATRNQVKIDSENFAKQVDDYLSGKMRSNDLINVGKTSQVLQSIGLPNNDIVLKQSKLKKIMQEDNNPNSKLHGLSSEIVKRIPEALNNPLNVLQSSTDKNSVVVITDLADKLERPIIASIEMNYEGKIGTIDFLSNRLTSAYGKNNYDRFMRTEIAKGNLLYDIDEGVIKELAQTRVPSPASPSSSEETSSINNIIPQDENKMQVQNENIFAIDENNRQQYSTNVNKNKQNYFETAQKYNIDTNNKTVTSIYDIAEKRGIQTRFDDTVFSNSSQNALWRVNEDGSREVILNPNADTNKTLQNVMVHELVHDFEGSKEYNTLSQMVIEKMQTQEGFEDAITGLQETYAKVYDSNSENFKQLVEQEAVADFLGENLGNQEFINDLVQKQDRNTVQKIYDWVVDKVKQFKNKVTGNNEALYWQKVQNTFEKAFNGEYQGKQQATSKFSIQTDQNGNQYVKVDTDQDIFEGIKPKDYNKIAKMYMQDYLKGKTELSKNDTAVIDSRAVNKYTNPTQKYSYMTEKMKLTPELKNVLKVAEKTIVAGPTKDTSKFPKWEYYKFNFELGGKTFEGNINIGIDKNGNKHFYEINKIHSIPNSSVSTNKVESMDSFNNSIAPINENVKRQNTTKYSMQKTENNTISDTAWQEFLIKNSVNKGKGETIQDVKLPIGENIKRNNNQQYSTNATKISNRQELPTNPTIYEDENVRAFKIATDNLMNDISTEEVNKMTETGKLPDTMKYISNKRTKPKASSKELWDSFNQKFVDKGHYIDKLANQTGNKELTYKYDRTLNAFSEAQYSIGEEQVNSKGEVVGASLKQLFEGAEKAGLENEFNDYLLNKHNIARSSVGKGLYGNSVSAPQSTRIVENYEVQHPEFKEWGQKVSKYNENNLQDMVNTGMISQDMFNKLRSLYGDYIPTYRDIIDESIIFNDNSVGGNVLGRATGGDQQILAPKEAMAEQTLAIKKAIRMNELGVELYKTLGKDSKVFEGIDFDAGAIQSLAGDVIQKAQDGMNTFIIFQDGQMTQFKISDELYTAFNKDTLQAKIDNSKLAKAVLTPVQKLSETQRDLLTTYSVGFALNNPIKDFQDAVFNTKYSVPEFAKNYVKSLYQIGTKGEIYKDYMRNGGNSNTYFDYERGILPNRNKIQKFVDKVKYVNEVLEQGPRLAEYMTTLERGGTKSEALYNSAEITTNFKRGGEITKVFNQYGANFLNASVQGLDKQIRNITGQNGFKGYAHLIARATLLGVAPSILNHLILSDSDDEEYYEDLPDYIKDSYYLIPKGKEGEFYRIPKGRVVATLGTIGRNFAEFAGGEQGLLETVENSVGGIMDNLAPNNPLKDNIASPIVQAKNNKAWYGGEIESSRLQKLPIGERKDEKTDKLSIWVSDTLQSNSITKYIADKLGISPKKINYVLDQYSGGVGDVLLPMATPYAENTIISDKFTTDSVIKNKNVEAFYTELQNSELLNNSEFASDTDKITYKYLSSSSKEVGELYSKKREVQSSNLSDTEKKERCRTIQAKINEKVKNTLKDLEGMTIDSNSASLGGENYYKVDGKWQIMSEEEKEKLGNISLDTYADYKNKVQEATNQKRSETGKEDAKLSDIEQIQVLQNSVYDTKQKDALYSNYIMNKAEEGKKTEYENLKDYYKSENIIDQYLDYKIKTSDKLAELKTSGQKEEGQSLSDKEKTQLLVDSKYSKEQTEALYVNVVASESNKNKYEILKSMNQGNSINEYLKFMLSDREADKEEDGTKSGKTIKGTKEEKITQTLNSLNLTPIARVYLLGTEYNLNTSSRRKYYNMMVNYIGDLSQKEQLKIIKTLNGVTEMKDGSYKY